MIQVQAKTTIKTTTRVINAGAILTVHYISYSGFVYFVDDENLGQQYVPINIFDERFFKFLDKKK